jgi:hypothetical protein
MFQGECMKVSDPKLKKILRIGSKIKASERRKKIKMMKEKEEE